MKPVSEQRLLRRNGTYYYRRRVPLQLVQKIGKKIVQVTLHTTSLKQAKKLRTLRDLEWDARFERYSISAPDGENPAVPATALTQPITGTELIQLVRDYVECQDK